MSKTDALRKKVHDYALKRRGKQEGTGECGDLPHNALVAAEAKSASDYGTVTESSVNQWGKPIELARAVPGDVLQFEGHVAEVNEVVETTIHFPDGSTLTYDESSVDTYRRKHHSAVLHSKLIRGVMTVLEQHVGRGPRRPQNTVDFGKIFAGPRPPEVQRARLRIEITPRWANELKSLPDANERAVNDLLKKYRGRAFDADVVTTKSISVRGKIHAYSPVAREEPD